MVKKAQRTPMAHAAAPVTGRDVIRIGYVPLVDSAPLIAALELGFFQREGIHVKLYRQIGWAGVREGLIFDELDAAHALAPMAYALKLGLGCAPTEVVVPYIISREGNAITLSVNLWNKGVCDGPTLRHLVRSQRPKLLTFAIVAECSSHRILLQKWLQSAGLDIQRDVKIVVLPPLQMVRNLRAGLIDGFCAGEPWNTMAIQEGIGWCPAVSAELSPDHPEKVLLVRSDFASRHQEELYAMIRALAAAAAVCEDPEGRQELVSLLAHKRYLNLSEEIIGPSLTGGFVKLPGTDSRPAPMHRFRGKNINRPTLQAGHWLFHEMQSSGLLPENMETPEHLPAAVFRSDLYETALQP
ncbi:MAG: CmpA/NrtA family ABC transporter substrate-binding protein [Methylacidiphilales bacterium]|nr:CmpA/NrtA family ABC transporter substrate-binding protein [Candidatus Methylacidiphilales bacterium]